MGRRSGVFSGVVLAVGTACTSGPAAHVAPIVTDFGPELSQAPTPDTFSPEGPLHVLHVSPLGPQHGPREVAIVFDRPIRALGEDGAGPAGFTIDPPVEGRWTWIGTHAVVFETTAHEFPDATAFRVRVPDDVAGIDGSRLQQSGAFEFETERPQAFIHDCASYDYITPDARFRLGFSQPTLPAEAERAVRVETLLGDMDAPWSPWPVLVVELARYPERAYQIVPGKPWVTGSRIRIRIDGELRSKAGPLPAHQVTEARCRAYPLPFATPSCGAEDEAGRPLGGATPAFVVGSK